MDANLEAINRIGSVLTYTNSLLTVLTLSAIVLIALGAMIYLKLAKLVDPIEKNTTAKV